MLIRWLEAQISDMRLRYVRNTFSFVESSLLSSIRVVQRGRPFLSRFRERIAVFALQRNGRRLCDTVIREIVRSRQAF